MRELGIGLIGTGFMGRAHALAFNQARAAFELPVRLTLAALADADAERAQRCADAWGYAQAHGGWQALVNDPGVDVVAITPPNHLHYPMAMAAIAAGKAVYCEKPLAISLEQADAMRRAANAAGVVTRVGYNYQHNPMIELARQMITAGELGEIISAALRQRRTGHGQQQLAQAWLQKPPELQDQRHAGHTGVRSGAPE